MKVVALINAAAGTAGDECRVATAGKALRAAGIDADVRRIDDRDPAGQVRRR